MEPELTSDADDSGGEETASKSAKDDVDEEGFTKLDHIKICISFGGVAMLLHSLFTVVLSGSQDILAGTLIPTTTILASHVATMVIVTSFLPWCMQQIPYFWRTLIVFAAMASGTLVLITVKSVYVKIIGVSLNALAHGLGEISFLALSAFYGKFSVTSFAAGSGAGILLGPIYYTAFSNIEREGGMSVPTNVSGIVAIIGRRLMTSWGCISPQATIAIISPATLLILLFYYMLDKDRLKPYAMLNTYKEIKSSDTETSHDHLYNKNPFELSWREKLSAAWQILPCMGALCTAYISQYITIHAVFTTIAFNDAPFAPRDHFVYYVLLNGIGEFITRSYLSIVAWVRPTLVPRLVLKRTWIFSFVLLAVMAFSICASYYRLFDTVWSVLLLCFVIGSLSGFVFSNTVCAVPLVVDPKYTEFCMGLVTVGESAGVLIASFAGIAVEPALRKHCFRINRNQSLCFTRRKTYSWDVSVCSIKLS